LDDGAFYFVTDEGHGAAIGEHQALFAGALDQPVHRQRRVDLDIQLSSPLLTTRCVYRNPLVDKSNLTIPFYVDTPPDLHKFFTIAT
jgi:hypothetical protein